METEARPATWKILLAFSMIYFVWGSTFLAIRVGVHEVPPFLLAAVRFFTAGLVMYAWLRLKGTPAPVPREWMAASALGALIFVVDYGCVFWAEQHVPSGIAAVVLATIPVFITLMEITFPAHATTDCPTQLRAHHRLVWCGGADESFIFLRRSSGESRGCDRLAGRFRHLVDRHRSLPGGFPSRVAKPMSAATQMLTGGAMLFVLAAVTGSSRASTRRQSRGAHGSRWSFSSSLVQLSDSPLTSGCCTTSRRRRWEPTHMSIRWSQSAWDIFSRRSGWSQDSAGNFAGAGERRYDYDDTKGWAG
jgi:hypothetical protein